MYWLFGSQTSPTNQRWKPTKESGMMKQKSTSRTQNRQHQQQHNLQESLVQPQNDDDDDDQEETNDNNNNNNNKFPRATSEEIFSRQWGFLFKNSNSLRFLVFDLICVFVLSFAIGLMQNVDCSLGFCKGLSIIVLLVQLPSFLFFVIKSPTRITSSRFDFCVTSLLHLFSIISSILIVISLVGNNSDNNNGLETLYLLTSILALFSGISDTICYVMTSSKSSPFGDDDDVIYDVQPSNARNLLMDDDQQQPSSSRNQSPRQLGVYQPVGEEGAEELTMSPSARRQNNNVVENTKEDDDDECSSASVMSNPEDQQQEAEEEQQYRSSSREQQQQQQRSNSGASRRRSTSASSNKNRKMKKKKKNDGGEAEQTLSQLVKHEYI